VGVLFFAQGVFLKNATISDIFKKMIVEINQKIIKLAIVTGTLST
jgi:hypothetical protein